MFFFAGFAFVAALAFGLVAKRYRVVDYDRRYRRKVLPEAESPLMSRCDALNPLGGPARNALFGFRRGELVNSVRHRTNERHRMNTLNRGSILGKAESSLDT